MPNEELKKLEDKIKNLKADDKKVEKVASLSGLNIAIELLSGTMIGIVVGYCLDKKLKSFPICLIIFIVIGFSAGFRNIWKRTNGNGS